jgi:hypothetical protein
MSTANHASSAEPSSHPAQAEAADAPPLPPRPAPKTGVDRVAERHAISYEPNEVTVDGEGSVEDYGEYAEGLLAVRSTQCPQRPKSLTSILPQDDAMLFITVRSASPADVPKVLQVVEHVKRLRHKRGNYVHPYCHATLLKLFLHAEVTVGSLSEELHPYVIYDAQPSVGLRRINLDNPAPNAYTPPSSLTVHLSKIAMPELRPGPSSSPKLTSSRSFSASSSSLSRRPLPPSPQEQVRASSAPLEAQVPTLPTQHPPQSHPQPQATGLGSLLWGRPRKWQH